MRNCISAEGDYTIRRHEPKDVYLKPTDRCRFQPFLCFSETLWSSCCSYSCCLGGLYTIARCCCFLRQSPGGLYTTVNLSFYWRVNNISTARRNQQHTAVVFSVSFFRDLPKQLLCCCLRYLHFDNATLE